MRWWNRLRTFLFDISAATSCDKRWDDFEKELQSDLELEAEEQQGEGLSPSQARQAAVRALGNPS
jgi:hypothetical protein